MIKRGFTIAELLAVIIVLAIIMLIVTPVLISTLDTFRKNTLQNSAHGLITAGKQEKELNKIDDVHEELIFKYENGELISNKKLNYKGKSPQSGLLVLNEDDEIGLAIWDGKYCAVKKGDSSLVTVSKKSENDCLFEINSINYTLPSCFTFNKNTNTITGYRDDCPKDVVIPKKIDGEIVLIIGENAFRSKQLTSVIIPNTVTRISDFAFYSNRLIDLELPDSVTVLSYYSFGWNQLKNVKFSQNLQYINSNAFYSNKLKNITLPKSLLLIGDSAFGRNELTEIIIPDNVTKIGYDAFSHNYILSAFIGKSVNQISSGAGGYSYGNIFSKNPIENISVSDLNPNYKSINGALYSKDGTTLVLGNIKMSNNISKDCKIIGEMAFNGYDLTSVTIPDKVEIIDSSAFSKNKLKDVIIPASVSTIKYGAFSNNQIESLTLSNGLTTIYSAAFANNNLTNLEIPDSVVSIYTEAFSDNHNLKTVTIGKSLRRILVTGSINNYGSNIFGKNINSLTVSKDNPYFTSINNAIYTKDLKTLVLGTIGMIDNIEPSTLTIGNWAFAGLDLEYINIPDNVLYLNERSFAYNQLKNITLSNSLIKIGERAFDRNNLTDILIPNSVTNISHYAFSYNYITQGNAKVDNKGENVTIGSTAFDNNGSNQKITITPTFLR